MIPRRLAGLGPEVIADRRGIRWALDLREGIDLSIYLFGVFEGRSVAAWRRLVRNGDTVLDVGANCGAHTLPLAHAVGPNGRVIAFEATTEALIRMRRTLDLNPELASRVTVCHSLLDDGTGRGAERAIFASWPVDGRTERADAHPLHCGVPLTASGAREETLDAALERLAVGTVAFMKLDVDGNELRVLRGATQLLKVSKPTILTELAPYGHVEQGEAVDALEVLFSRERYALAMLDGNLLAAGLSARMQSGSSVNVIAQPIRRA